ncbi:MAG: hypothetical protein K0V04_26415 [Deltaproteobacteria bacterium]|nr:hypothetical protein [Deltaproteobacteria bacterium]
MLLLLGLLLFPALGCMGELGARDVEDIDEQHCDQLESVSGAASDPQQRFHWYRTQLVAGEALPTSVTTRGGGGASLTYVGRSNTNEEIEQGFDMGSFFAGLQMTLIGLVCLMLVVVLAIAVGVRSGQYEKVSLRPYVRATLLMIVVAILSGYPGGSLVTIDNSSTSDVVVELNGTRVELPANHHANVRASGMSFDVETKSGDQAVETLVLHPDAGITDTLRRMLWFRDRYYYSVCGHNRLTVGTAKYGS